MANKTKIVRIISPKQTLLSIDVGETVVIPTRKIKSDSLRVTALRLNQRNEYHFVVSTEGLVNETRVTRLK